MSHKAFFILILVATTVFFMGCTTSDLEQLANYDPSVQQFIEDHPNAEINVSLYTSMYTSSLNEIFPSCIIAENKDYYLIEVTDVDSNLRLKVLADKITQETICVHQEGKLENPPQDNNTDTNAPQEDPNTNSQSPDSNVNINPPTGINPPLNIIPPDNTTNNLDANTYTPVGNTQDSNTDTNNLLDQNTNNPNLDTNTTTDTNTEQTNVSPPTKADTRKSVSQLTTYTYHVDLTNPDYNYTSPDGYQTIYSVYYLNLPLNPASNLIKDIFADTNVGTHILIFDNNAQTWVSYGKTRGGWMGPNRATDMTLNPGQGFVIYVHNEGDITLTGTTITQSPTINLKGRLNLIGIPHCNEGKTANDILEEVNQLDSECKTMFRVESNINSIPGRGTQYWSLDPNYNSEHIQNNFDIDSNTGYWIVCGDNTNVNWTHTCNTEIEAPQVEGEIRTCEDLNNIRNNLSGNYFLTRDIDCSDTKNWVGKDLYQHKYTYHGFPPIGQSADPINKPFTGTLDGNGFTINGLYSDYVTGGLFEGTENATIKNLVLTGVSISGTANMGSLVGFAKKSTITGNKVSGYVAGTQQVGGIVGKAWASNIERNSFSGTINAIRSNGSFGGIAGTVGYDIINNKYIETIVKNNYFDGTIIGGGKIGGIVGISFGKTQILNNYSLGEIQGKGSYVGGIGGFFENQKTYVQSNYSLMQITKLYTSSTYYGGLIGYVDSPNLSLLMNSSENYWDITLSGQANCWGHNINTGCTSTDNNEVAYHGINGIPFTKLNWDTTIWEANEGEHPTLCGDDCSGPQQIGEIRTCEDLQNIQNDLSEDYYLSKDIYCADTVNWNDGKGFDPIGEYNNAIFTGTLNGNGWTIYDLYINRPMTNTTGLFEHVRDAIIENINLIDYYVEGSYNVGSLIGTASGNTIIRNNSASGEIGGTQSYDHIGGIVGSVFSGKDTKIIGNVSKGNLYSTGTTGGIIGYVKPHFYTNEYTLEVNNNHNLATLTGNRVGGIVGECLVCNIENNYNEGQLNYRARSSQYNPVGGIVGMLQDSTVTKNYNIGEIIELDTGRTDAMLYIGGIVGADRVLSTNTTNSTINNNYNVGKITAGIATDYDALAIHGIIGDLHDETNVTNNYFDITLTGQSTCGSTNNLGCVSTNNEESRYFGTAGIPFSALGWSTSIWQANEGAHPTLN